MRYRALFLALALLLSGCFTQPIRTDPFSDLGVAEKRATPYRDLTVALVLSKTTISSMEFRE